MTQLSRRDVEQHVLPARVVFGQALREIPYGRCQFAIRTTELIEKQRRERRIGFRDAEGYSKRLLCMNMVGPTLWIEDRC